MHVEAVMKGKSGEGDRSAWDAETQLAVIDIRDKVIDCLLSTHGDYFAKSRAALGLDSSDSAVRESARGMVKLAFQSVGGSYDAPTLSVLAKVVNLLAERLLSWGATPDCIFDYHCALMQEIGRAELAHEPGGPSGGRPN
jgi:hypothetical protein